MLERRWAFGVAAVLLFVAGAWWWTSTASTPRGAVTASRSIEAPNQPAAPAAHVTTQRVQTVERPTLTDGATVAGAADPHARLVRDSLAATWAAKFPDQPKSDAQLDRMTSAIMKIRSARHQMRALRFERSEGGKLRQFRDEIGEAAADFEQVAGMSLSSFTEQVQEGLTVDEPEGAVQLRVLERPAP